MGTYFTDLTDGQQGNAATFNAPLVEFDDVFADILDGTQMFTEVVIGSDPQARMAGNAITFARGGSDNWELVHLPNGQLQLRDEQNASAEVIRISTTRLTIYHPLNIDDDVGFFGTAAIGQQTVTGSTDSAKITSLIATLVAYGLIVDGTT